MRLKFEIKIKNQHSLFEKMTHMTFFVRKPKLKPIV